MLIARDPATGREATIIMPRAEFLAWLHALGKTRLYDVIFTTASHHQRPQRCRVSPWQVTSQETCQG